jgi:hypothetical protein
MPEPVMESGSRDTYTGTIRVYVLEAIGRWDDDDGNTFHNAFISFALQEGISLAETDTLTWDLLWNGNDYVDYWGHPYNYLTEDNVKVVAAVFNSSGYPGYSDPPTGGQFIVNEVDACAGTMCGMTGYNTVYDNFTHTVLLEDGATTW